MTLPKNDALRASRYLLADDFRERATMEEASRRFLHALWREHPSIMRSLGADR